MNEYLVLGNDLNLWLEHRTRLMQVPPPREQVDRHVFAFQALSDTEVLVLGSDGNLWLEHSGANGKFGVVPPPREQVDGNVTPASVSAMSRFSGIWAYRVSEIFTARR